MPTRVFHPVARTSEAHLRYVIGPKQCENIYAYQWNNTTPPTGSELLNLGSEVWGTIGVKVAGMLSSDVAFYEVYCRNIDTETANEATYTLPAIVHGSQSGTRMASNVAFNPIKQTGLTGRSHHGANHYSGFVDTEINGDQFLTFVINQIISIALSVLATRVGGRFIPALASRKLAASTLLRAYAFNSSIVDSAKKRIADA
jgi:hypothetical protein